MRAPGRAWIRRALAMLLIIRGVTGVAAWPGASPPSARAASALLPVVAAERLVGQEQQQQQEHADRLVELRRVQAHGERLERRQVGRLVGPPRTDGEQ